MVADIELLLFVRLEDVASAERGRRPLSLDAVSVRPRTHLTHGRLSEDIDLIARGDRRAAAEAVVQAAGRALFRSHGRIRWSPAFVDGDVEPAVAVTPGGVAIKIQLLDHVGYPPWTTEIHRIEQGYSDAPPAALRVPTRGAFIGWKTSAWLDRRVSRDLYDLWALSQQQPFGPQAVELFKKHGPTGRAPSAWMFRDPPSTIDWHTDLAGQTRLTVEPLEAVHAVRLAWATAVGEDWDDRANPSIE
jgi:Nucleotidyl transferase AbiEii toxin, Type IV TA system